MCVCVYLASSRLSPVQPWGVYDRYPVNKMLWAPKSRSIRDWVSQLLWENLIPLSVKPLSWVSPCLTRCHYAHGNIMLISSCHMTPVLIALYTLMKRVGYPCINKGCLTYNQSASDAFQTANQYHGLPLKVSLTVSFLILTYLPYPWRASHFLLLHHQHQVYWPSAALSIFFLHYQCLGV